MTCLLFNISCQQASDENTGNTATNEKPTNAIAPAAPANNNNAQPNKPAATATTDAPKVSTKTQVQKPLTTTTNAPKGAVNWLSVAEVQEKVKTEPRKVIVDLYTDWCGWCKRMDKATFQHPEIAKYINDNFYAVKFNAETKENVTFKDKDYKFIPRGRKGTNELTYKFVLGDKPTGRVGYPTIAFLDENLDRIEAYAGYKDAHNFDELMHFVKDGKKGVTFQDFQQTYDSSIPAAPARGSNKRTINVNPRKNKQNAIKNRNATAKGNSNIKINRNINNTNLKVRKVESK